MMSTHRPGTRRHGVGYRHADEAESFLMAFEASLHAAMPWRTDAACKGADTHVPPPGERMGKRKLEAARKICASCPVQVQCLQHAYDFQEYGLWGGLFFTDPAEARQKGHPYASHEKQNLRGGSITEQDMADIRARLAEGGRGTAAALAKEYGVSDSRISAIKRGVKR